MEYNWNIAFTYTLANEPFELGSLGAGTVFAEGVRVVTEKQERSTGEEIQLSAEPAPGAEGLFPVARKVQLTVSVRGSDLEGVMLNGYQSWTETRERDPGDLPRRLRSLFRPWINKYLLRRYGDAWFTGDHFPRGEYHGFSWALLRFGSHSLLLGGLSENGGFSRIRWKPEASGRGGKLIFEPELSEAPISGVRQLLHVALLQGREEELFHQWAALAGISLPEAVRGASPVSGWTSWYDYYEKVTEKDVLKVLDSWGRLNLPGTCMQIDDGWQHRVGDWLKVKDTFPRGMGPLAEDIRRAGREPGLWLAPFVAEEASELFQDHRDWFLLGKNGEPLAAGYNPFNWSGRFYALDYRHPDVRNYLRRVFKTVVGEWGFRLLKLDFLYAAVLDVPHGYTRGGAMREAMEFIREISADARILGCGVPLLSAAGLVDYCRIGGDVGLSWEDRRLEALAYPERVSTLNSLRNCISRRGLDGVLFGNDPDVFILRDWNCSLKEPEKYTLFLCNNIFGSLLFTSDDPGMYTAETLALFRSAFPMRRKEHLSVDRIGERYQVRFSIGRLQYTALINLEERHHRFELPPGLHYGAATGFRRGGEVELKGRSSACFLAVGDEGISIAGSTGQLFPGSEIERFQVQDDEVSMEISPEAVCEGEIYLRLPMHLKGCTINGTPFTGEDKVDFNLVVIPKSHLR